MTSVSMMADQVKALNGLLREVDGFAVEVEPGEYMSLTAIVFTRLPGGSEDDGAVRVRWFSISVAGTIRERAPEPEVVPA